MVGFRWSVLIFIWIILPKKPRRLERRDDEKLNGTNTSFFMSVRSMPKTRNLSTQSQVIYYVLLWTFCWTSTCVFFELSSKHFSSCHCRMSSFLVLYRWTAGQDLLIFMIDNVYVRFSESIFAKDHPF